MDRAPLVGVKVLDLSAYTPGPFATQILADLGATVLKLEKPGIGDPERLTVPGFFRAYNRGKHSIALDLTKPEDREQALALASGADVFIEGFRPGVTDRLGLGFERLSAINLRVIYVSLSGLGSWHDHALDRGHDPEFLARVGALAVTPRPGGVPMYDLPFPAADFAAGMYAVVGILATLLDPGRKAIHLETPIMAAALAWTFPRLVNELEYGAGTGSGRDADRHAGIGCFETRDKRYITITAVEEHLWKPLATWIGRPELGDDPDYDNFAKRMKFGKEINALIAEAVARHDLAECVRVFDAMGMVYAPVNTPAEALDDPVVAALGLLHKTPNLHCDTPIMGLKLERNIRWPELGEDSEAVRRDGWDALADGTVR